MSEPTIRTSHASLSAIPSEHVRILHSMYEDSDLRGAREAEELIEWLEQQAPGQFVGILANDSVSPPCAYTADEHYPCDYYAEYWYTVLISKKVWDEHEERVKAKDQEWKDAHQCKLSYANKDTFVEGAIDEEFEKSF